MLARANLTLVSLVTLVGWNISGWNRTHIFSVLWSPHAHFHGAWFVVAISLLSVLSLWLIWSRTEQPARSRIAALIQGCLWVFFPAMLVPDTALADLAGRSRPSLVSISISNGAIAHVILLVLALVLLQAARL